MGGFPPADARGEHPRQLYTDHRFHNIGVPFNREIPGVAKGAKQGLSEHVDNDAKVVPGFFRTPTVRNVAKGLNGGFTKAFAHNGYFKSLEGIVHFYNTRDVKPRCETIGLQNATEKEARAALNGNGCWPAPEFGDFVATGTGPFVFIGDLKLTPDRGGGCSSPTSRPCRTTTRRRSRSRASLVHFASTDPALGERRGFAVIGIRPELGPAPNGSDGKRRPISLSADHDAPSLRRGDGPRYPHALEWRRHRGGAAMVEVLERVDARAGVGGSAHPRCLACDVRQVAVCAAVGPEHLPRLAAIAAERGLAAGQGLFEEGEPAEAVYVVAEGMIKLYKLMSDGRRQISGFLVPGRLSRPRLRADHVYGAEAVIPTTVCRFRRAPFLELLDECPALEKEILTADRDRARGGPGADAAARAQDRARAGGELPRWPSRGAAGLGPDEPLELRDEPGRHRRLSGPDRRDGQPDADPAAADAR